MTRIFISGHMDGNRTAFEVEAERLRSFGHVVVTPFDLEYPSNQWAPCMTVALAEIRDCDAISLLPGWSDWPGPVVERHAAIRFGLAITVAPPTKECALHMLSAAVEMDSLLARIRAARQLSSTR